MLLSARNALCPLKPRIMLHIMLALSAEAYRAPSYQRANVTRILGLGVTEPYCKLAHVRNCTGEGCVWRRVIIAIQGSVGTLIT